MLEVKGVCAGYGRVQVLWDVDLTMSANEIVALVGPNGAGKTTLLRALSGMVPIRDGSVTFLGEDITGRSIERIVDLWISHVPEGRRLFPGLTVKDNLRLGGWRNRNTDIDRVIDLFPKLGDRLSQVTGCPRGVRRATSGAPIWPAPTTAMGREAGLVECVSWVWVMGPRFHPQHGGAEYMPKID